MTVPCTSANGANVGYSYPATGGWGEACGDYWNESATGAPELGQLLRLNLTDQQIAASPAPAWQKTIMTALSHYGAYIEDTDGSWDSGVNVITQDSESWTDLGQPDQWAALAKQYGTANGMLELQRGDPGIRVSGRQRLRRPPHLPRIDPHTRHTRPTTDHRPHPGQPAGSAGDDARPAGQPADPAGRNVGPAGAQLRAAGDDARSAGDDAGHAGQRAGPPPVTTRSTVIIRNQSKQHGSTKHAPGRRTNRGS